MLFSALLRYNQINYWPLVGAIKLAHQHRAKEPPYGRFFHFKDKEIIKSIAYIDGYNLYYSRLRHTSYKWLDLHSLFSQIAQNQNIDSTLTRVKFYTAPTKTKFSFHGEESGKAQTAYHRALTSPKTGMTEIISGEYIATKDTPMRYLTPPDKGNRVDTWKLEEKRTDVNMALDIYRDAVKGDYQQALVCTGDTDLIQALRYVRIDFPELILGLIHPGRDSTYYAPKGLKEQASWFLNHITDAALDKAQFPNRVSTVKKPADKPKHW